MAALARRARKQGFQPLGRKGSGHEAILAPDGTVIVYAFSPSDHRSVRALRADLKRHGFKD